MQSRIFVRDINCFAYHGLLPQERELGQQFKVTLELTVEVDSPGEDRLENTVDYRSAVETVHRIMDGPSRKLLETLADELAEALLRLPRVTAVRVLVEKPHPPIPGVLGGISVETVRKRGD